MTRPFGTGVTGSAAFAEAADLSWKAADTVGRVPAGADQALRRPRRPAERLRQAVTTLREHRGDGHGAALVGAGLGPVEAMVLKAACGESDGPLLRETRKWERADRAAGGAARAAVDARTDAAAERPWAALGAGRTARLAGPLEPPARTVERSGLLPMGNPVGLTRGERAPGRP
ncbi:hypothetical protein QQY24_28820 [Streptomyces sp. TG1A-8]|uniref:helix-turn-helix domain-containing protein n=1 Tax=Streptomyces sp. TG1A-8 TaxID=3051385 RepID=UPI00265C236F|nr:hypothetical protein [Streptomyces sp. TG1A-8]MDO0929219.1 hypothetical protein [Streptomyces sp. TG1A-8]